MKIFLKELTKESALIFYHVVVVSLSAAIALSLPYSAAFVAQNVLVYWPLIETQRAFLILVEVGLAVLLILCFNFIARIWKGKKLAGMARTAGLVFVAPNKGFFARRRIRKLKTQQGFARDVMFIGSTGYRTFVEPTGELYHVIQNCREARIMLLSPNSRGTDQRARSILSPDITPESLGVQIWKSIGYLKGLKAIQKNIRLKLYMDSPFLKLTVLGDYLWIQHYHPGIDVEVMPKYLFKHNQNPKSLYVPLYQYSLARWENPDIPEFDFDRNELVYRDPAGNELRREKLEETGGRESTPGNPPDASRLEHSLECDPETPFLGTG
jgi:hypothetical protein